MTEDHILVIHFGALGDVVATFPALLRLKEVYGSISMVCQSNIGSLARYLDIADHWFPLETASFASLYTSRVDPAVEKILRSFPIIILFSGSRSFEKTLLSITGKDIYRINSRPDPVQKTRVARHILSNLIRYELLEESDIDVFDRLHPTIYQDRRDSDDHRLKILIHPGSGSRKKCWPIENFIKTAALIETRGLRPEFILGPAEYDFYDILTRRQSSNAKVHQVDSLTKLALLLKTGGGFVGNDSGVSHLSAFLGLSTVAVFGPSDPDVWQPLGRSVKILQSNCECSPCFDTGTTGCNEIKCLNSISPVDVFEAFCSLIR
jgi:heptosyltransferase-3